jgi:hypothetical protein
VSRARISIIGYSIYLATAGAGIALVPNLILPIVGLPASDTVWARLAGCLAFVLALKGLQNSRYELVPTFQLDVYTRSFVATFLVVLVLLHIAAPIFLLLTAFDYGGALWTQLAIRSDARSAPPKAA